MTDLSIDRPAATEPAPLAERAWRHRYDIVGLALVAVIWVAIVVFAEPFGRLWGTGQDAYCYWFPSLADPYARSDWTDPIAYVYSPAFLQLLEPIRALPWQAYVAVWTAILLGAVFVLTGRKWFAVGVVLGLMELAGGNIHLLLAAAMVLGFRWPATWALVLLTKITPGIGLLVVRGPRRMAAAVHRAGGDGAHRGRVVRDACPTPGSQWVGVLTRDRRSRRHVGRGADPVPRAAAVRGGARGLGRAHEPPLDGARGRDAGPSRALVRRPRDAPGGHRVAGAGTAAASRAGGDRAGQSSIA